jgi:hypothetical protein
MNQPMKPTDKHKDIPTIIQTHKEAGTHSAYTRKDILNRIAELHGKASERYAMHLESLEKPENEFIHQLYLDYDEFTYAIKYLIEKLPA